MLAGAQLVWHAARSCGSNSRKRKNCRCKDRILPYAHHRCEIRSRHIARLKLDGRDSRRHPPGLGPGRSRRSPVPWRNSIKFLEKESSCFDLRLAPFQALREKQPQRLKPSLFGVAPAGLKSCPFKATSNLCRLTSKIRSIVSLQPQGRY